MADPAATDRRAVLRLFTYGLHAVSVCRGDDRNAFTANWLTQVSFDPPLVALSVENDAHSISFIRDTRVFVVNVLPAGSREVAGLLGKRRARVPDKLDQVAWHPGPHDCPVLEIALGYLVCAVESSVPAGDSTLFVARVTDARLLAEGAPLTMAETGFKHAG